MQKRILRRPQSCLPRLLIISSYGSTTFISVLKIIRIDSFGMLHRSCPGRPFCAGIILEKLYVYSSNEGGESEVTVPIPGVIDKRVKLQKLGVYWDYNQPLSVDTSSADTLFDGMLAPFASSHSPHPLNPQHFLLQPISLELQVHLDMRRVELRKPSVEEAVSYVSSQLGWASEELRVLQRCYLHIRSDGNRGRSIEEEWKLVRNRLLVKHGSMFTSEEALRHAHLFCERCWDVSNTASPMVIMDGEMDRFVLTVDKEQYQDVLEFMTSLSIQTVKAKFRRFRPEEKDPVAAPRAWWKFAITAVIDNNRQYRKHSGWNEYVKFKETRDEYIELYKRKNDPKQPAKKDPRILMRLQKLEDRLTLENILLFRKIALNELNDEEKKKETKKRSLFARKSRKTLESSLSPVSENENELQWNEDRRRELLTEFDISPDEVSPWEGGRPKDIQIRVDFRLHTLGLYLVNRSKKLVVCKLKDTVGRFFKRKEFTQFWCCVEDVKIQDKKNQKSPWKNILYTEKEAIYDNTRIVQFLPSDMLKKEELPFLQVAVELPSLDKDVDMRIQVSSLPLCLVMNLLCIFEVLEFLIPDLSKTNFSAFKASSLMKEKRHMKVAKEIAAHKLIGLDVNVGALSVLIPANVEEDMEHTQVVVIRLGDISTHSNPIQVDKDAVLTEDNVYDMMLLTVSDIGLLMTDYHIQWESQKVQNTLNLSLIHDFDISAAIGISIAPSEPQFASVKVVLSLSLIDISLTQNQYLEFVQWFRGVTDSAVVLMKQSSVDLRHLSAATTHMVTRFLPESPDPDISTEEQEMKRELREYSQEEKTVLQQNRILDFQCIFKGVSLSLIEYDSLGIATPLIEATVSDLEIFLHQRTFDLTMNCVLSAVSIRDCIQSQVLGHDAFMIMSNDVNETTPDNPQLIRISICVINRDSPEYATSTSDVSLSLELGSMSFLVFRPTVSRVVHFILPESLLSTPRQGTGPQSKYPITTLESSVDISEEPLEPSLHLFVYLHRQLRLLFHNRNSIKDWLRCKLQLNIALQSASILLLTDTGKRLLVAGVRRIDLGFGICPAMIEVTGALGDVKVTDCSEGCGLYSSVLSINEVSSNTSFIHFTITVYRNHYYPQYPGHPLTLKCTVLSPCVTLRRRVIEEVLKYFGVGSLANIIILLYQLEKSTKLTFSSEKRMKSSSVIASAVEIGRNFITECEKDCTLPIILPYLDITVTNFVIQIPESSTSESMTVFELGYITVSNSEPSLPMTSEIDRQILSSLNTVTFVLEKMRAYTVQPSTTPQSLIGSISIEATVILANQLDVNVHMSKLAITLNEHQISFFLKTVNGNLQEESLCCKGDLKWIMEKLDCQPAKSSSMESKKSIGKDVSMSISLDGLIAEFLYGSGGYPYTVTGDELNRCVGMQSTSFMFLDMTNLLAFGLIKETEVSGGLSLASVSIHDSRHQSSIHPSFTVPFLFGGVSKPALTVLITLRRELACSYSELSKANIPSDQYISDFRVSVCIGNLRILPTPWIFEFLTLIETLKDTVGKELHSVLISTKSPLISSISSVPKEFGSHMLLDIRVDNPYVFLVEDTTREASPTFLISFSADVSVTVSPLRNLDVTLSVSGIRGCRGSVLQKVLPQPSMLDAIHPFDINMNIHVTNQMKQVHGTLTSERVSVRVGMKDILLMIHAVRNLVPPCILNRISHISSDKKTASSHSLSWVTGLRFPWILNLFGSVNELSVVVVNDTEDSELPVAHAIIKGFVVTVGMTEDLLKAEGRLSVEAEYYHAAKSVWEPVLETWMIQMILEMEPRGRILQRVSGDHSSYTDLQNAITRFYIISSQPLNISLTSTFLIESLTTIHDFQQCSSTQRTYGNNYFMGLRNCTGMDAIFRIEDDGGVNHLQKESEIGLNEEEMDVEFFAGLAIVESSRGEGTHWVEIHTLEPHIRIFDSIPFVRSSNNPRFWSNVFELKEGSQNLLIPVCSFLDASQKSVTILVGSMTQYNLWIQYLKRVMETPLIVDPRAMEGSIQDEYSYHTLPSTGKIINTSLPAHPSLSLLYFHQPYRKLPPRTITIQFMNMPPFALEVDRIQSVGILLKGKEEELQIVVEANIERGMKILTFSVPVKVTNRTNRPLECAFGTDSSSPITSLLPNHSIWGSEQILKGGLVMGSQRRLITIDRIQNQLGTGIVNMGNEYVMVKETVHSVPLLSHPLRTFPFYHLIISDILTLENLLPESLEYRIVSCEGKVVTENLIKPGGVQRITSCKFSKKEGLRVSIRLVNDSYDFSSYDESINPTLSQPTGICILVNSETGAQLRLHYIFTRLDYGAWNLQLFCKYWIMNKTGDDLILSDATDSAYCYTASGYPVDVKTENETVWNHETLLQPVLFSVCEDGKKEEARVTLKGGSQWSQPFSINAPGMRGECIVTGRYKGEREHCYAVVISRAPGIFARSLVVILTPLYVIVNQITKVVRIRQEETLENAVLQPESSIPFHWTSLSSPHSLQLLLDQYSWSSPFPLSPGHYSLALHSPLMDSSILSSHLFIPPSDPMSEPQSVLQVDVVVVEAQCLVFLRQVLPKFLSVCVSNDTLIETITICQNGASFNSAISLPPLTSRMIAFPLVQTDPSFLVFSREVGTFLTPASFTPVFVASLSHPGHLGEFTTTCNGVGVTVSVDVLMHRNTHILVFKSGESNQQDSERLHLLTQRNFLLEQFHETNEYLKKYFDTLPASSSVLTSFLIFQFIQSLSCSSNHCIRFRFEAISGENHIEGSDVQGVLGAVMERMSVPAESVVKIRVTLCEEGGRERSGEGVLDLSEYKDLECLMEVCVPCIDKEGQWLCEMRVIVVNTLFESLASKISYKLTVQQLHDEVEDVLERCTYEWKLEKRQKKENESHILRATASGFYRIQSQSHLMKKVEDFDLHFSVMLHSLKRLPESFRNTKGLYALISVGSITLRTPLCTHISPDSELQDSPIVTLIWRHFDSDCVLKEQDGSFVVTQISHNSLTFIAGLRVGHRLVRVNGVKPPEKLSVLMKLIDGDSYEKVLEFESPQGISFYQSEFNQDLVFPVGATFNKATFSVSVYEETDLLEDPKLCTQSFQIVRESDLEMSMIVENDFCLWLETSWESEDIEQDVMKIGLQMDINGLGISLVDKVPRELIYLSMTGIRGIFAMTENGEKICNMKIQSLQIDNQCMESSFPVLLGCSAPDWLSITVLLRPHPSVIYVEGVDVKMQDLSVNIETSLLSSLVQLIRDLPLDIFSQSEKEWLLLLQHDPRFVQ